MDGQRSRVPFEQVSALVLDGGRALRFGGAHKAFLVVDGEPIAHRTVRALRELFAEVLVATTRPGPWLGLGVRLVDDALPGAGAGPLSGIAGALEAATTPFVLAVAGDMPHVSPEVLALVARRAIAGDRSAAPVVDGRVEPLCAVYCARDAASARQALARGLRRPADFLREVGFAEIGADELAGVPGAERAFRNLNSPDDLASG